MNCRNIRVVLSAVILMSALPSCGNGPDNGHNTQYIDPYIGTGGHGHVFMGANVPFGLVQLGPTSIPQTWDWVSGYHISDTTVIGFSHLHLSGTGIGDLSDIVLMPTTGPVNHNRGTHEGYDTGMWSYFSRANEKVAPGYYATRLDRYGVDVELTATQRVGFHKYTFPADASDARVVIDLENGTCWDASVENYMEMIDSRTIAGYRYSKAGPTTSGSSSWLSSRSRSPISGCTTRTLPSKAAGSPRSRFTVKRCSAPSVRSLFI